MWQVTTGLATQCACRAGDPEKCVHCISVQAKALLHKLAEATTKAGAAYALDGPPTVAAPCSAPAAAAAAAAAAATSSAPPRAGTGPAAVPAFPIAATLQQHAIPRRPRAVPNATAIDAATRGASAAADMAEEARLACSPSPLRNPHNIQLDARMSAQSWSGQASGVHRPMAAASLNAGQQVLVHAQPLNFMCGLLNELT